MSSDSTAEPSRPYHHGDLHAALLETALDLAREGGPAAVSLREVTRRVGVSPAAAYRHVRDREALLRAAAREVQARMVVPMRERRARSDGPADAAARALDRLRGVGLGYIDFALAEPGWFATALLGAGDPPDEGPAHAAPFLELLAALDDCVETGVLSPSRRPGAEFSCWSAVHGCAELLVRGPLRGADAETVRTIAEKVVDDIIAGIR
ncbi:TetR family transcriptional regulator [Brachybacterium phenoliresistens]|uniref:TetR family transcriptional regulator n=1 Tax=Brachybacterium phenoliresistens TaxID=396014 RepID=Z9JQW1_9MICO|nr:TetR/AcrR family transcriptional regulator [Brachybacterium phenoliresistens]EWS80127.1 TetR family transcriptional regulator [Brachybacterium phenoliresistens]